MNKDDIVAILVLTIIVTTSVATLAVTDSVTREKIEEAKRMEIQQNLAVQFPDMTDFIFDKKIGVYTIYMGNTSDEDNIIGYAFEAQGSGYGGTIEMLVTLKDFETLNGIAIISHMETPGLGAKITESSFTDQFKNLAIEDIALRSDNGQVDAISGATISSSAVVDAIKKTTLKKIKLLQENANETGG